MSTYPPNQTTPKSGNYLWNWLGSPLKKFAAALAPYLGGGGDSGYSYTEIDILPAELINPGVIVVGNPPSPNTGKELLPPCAANQYYDAEVTVEFLPGATPYTTAVDMSMYPNNLYVYVNYINIENKYLACLFKNKYTYDIYNQPGGSGLYLAWAAGNFTDGDGSFKVKIWYKTVNFG